VDAKAACTIHVWWPYQIPDPSSFCLPRWISFPFQQFRFECFRTKRYSISTSTGSTTITILYTRHLRLVQYNQETSASALEYHGPNSSHRARAIRTSLQDRLICKKVILGTSAGHCSNLSAFNFLANPLSNIQASPQPPAAQQGNPQWQQSNHTRSRLSPKPIHSHLQPSIPPFRLAQPPFSPRSLLP
jgi:hypothetical protein